MKKIRGVVFILAFAFLFSSSLVSASLIAHYSFEENLLDSVGNVHGTAYGGPLNLVDGSSDKAYHFGGTSYVSLGNSFSNQITQRFTISAWIKLDESATNPQVISYLFWKSDDQPGISIEGMGGYARTVFSHRADGTGRIHGGNLLANKWYFVTFTYDGHSLIGYVNGQQVGGSNDLGYSPGGVVYVGRDENGVNDNSYFKGAIDELKIWDRALFQSEIQTEFNDNREFCLGYSLYESLEGLKGRGCQINDGWYLSDSSLVNNFGLERYNPSANCEFIIDYEYFGSYSFAGNILTNNYLEYSLPPFSGYGSILHVCDSNNKKEYLLILGDTQNKAIDAINIVNNYETYSPVLKTHNSLFYFWDIPEIRNDRCVDNPGANVYLGNLGYYFDEDNERVDFSSYCFQDILFYPYCDAGNNYRILVWEEERGRCIDGKKVPNVNDLFYYFRYFETNRAPTGSEVSSEVIGNALKNWIRK